MKRSGLSLSDSGGLGLSQSGNHFITSNLSSSGPLPKKAKYLSYYGIAEDFCGFSDEPSVHLNAVKMMNTELFCKSRQLTENINTLQAKIQSASKKEESLKQNWNIIQSKGQSILQEISNKIQNELPNNKKTLEIPQKSNLIEFTLLHCKDLKSLTDEQRAYFEKIRNSVLNKTTDHVLSKNLSVRQEESVLFNAHSLLATQIEELKNQFLSLEEESRAFNIIQDEIKQTKEKIESLKKIHSGLNLEQDTEEQQNMYGEEDKIGSDEAFETSKAKNEIAIFQAIAKSKEDTKSALKNQLTSLQKQIPRQPLLKLSDDLIRESNVVKSVENRSQHFLMEGEMWGHEAHGMMIDLAELDRQRSFDKDLMSKLDQMHTRANHEKVTHLHQRANHLRKEKEQLQEKFEEKKKEVQQKDLLHLTSQLAQIESKVENAKQIIDQKENEKATLFKQLESLELTAPELSTNHSNHSNSLLQFIRNQHNLNLLIIEEITNINAELQDIQKKKNAAQVDEKELVNLINRQKTKVTTENIKKAELLAREKSLATQVKSLQQEYLNTIAHSSTTSPQNQLLSNKLAQMLSSDIFTRDENEAHHHHHHPTNTTNTTTIDTLVAKREELIVKLDSIKTQVEDTLMINQEMKEEINEVHSEFLRELNENITQMKQLAEYEENNLKLLAQCTKQHQINALLKRKLEILTDKIAKFEQKAHSQDDLVKKYSKKMKISETQVLQANQEADFLKLLADSNDLIKDNGNQLFIELKQRYEDLLKEIENAKGLVDTNILIEKEKAQQSKLKDEIYILNQKIDFTTKHKIADTREGDDEVLTYYKKLINCSVCQERPKNFVITRCYHLFCQECVESYSECPTCFRAYNERDMKQIFI